MLEHTPDCYYKILTLGESGVGKTSIILRYVDNIFSKSTINTLSVDFKTKDIVTNNKLVRLNIWDTAGQEKFNHLTKQYYQGADGLFLIYDIEDKSSLNKINQWMTELSSYMNKDNVGIVLIGNKLDSDNREVTESEGHKMAERHGLLFTEVSALTRDNLDKAFKMLIRDIMNKKQLNSSGSADTRKVSIAIDRSSEDNSRCC